MILDHEDNRENVERKKEGVLWGAGTWEEVGKGGKMKWEKYWVVLDHSSIYEVST
jgi:outer membrane translocation and assembly module TamA